MIRQRHKQMLDRSLDATRSGLQETRRALKSLRASPLDDLGLILALRRMSEETARRANLALDLSLPSNSLLLPDGVEQTIYRIAQEALANVAHHANAHTLRVQLSTNPSTGSAQSGNGLSLIVQDDGLGFDPQQAQTAGHFGLPGMDERAALVGGDLTVSSQPGQGTTVRLLLKDVAMQPLTDRTRMTRIERILADHNQINIRGYPPNPRLHLQFVYQGQNR